MIFDITEKSKIDPYNVFWLLLSLVLLCLLGPGLHMCYWCCKKPSIMFFIMPTCQHNNDTNTFFVCLDQCSIKCLFSHIKDIFLTHHKNKFVFILPNCLNTICRLIVQHYYLFSTLSFLLY